MATCFATLAPSPLASAHRKTRAGFVTALARMPKPSPMTAAEARKQLARDLDEPDRIALTHVQSTLQSAQALAVAAFGDAATPDHALTLLDHLLTQAERAALDDDALDEGE